MKKSIFKVLAMAGVVTAALVLLFLVDRFVFEAIEAEKKIAAYEEYHYGAASGVDMQYNWKMGSGYVGGGYNYNPDFDLILDGARNDESRTCFEKTMRVIDTYDINFEFADYGVITYYDGSDVSVRYDDLYIYEFYNTQFVEEEKRIETGATLIWETLSWNDLKYYNINGIHVDYYDPSGVIHYSVNIDKSRKSTEDISIEMLIEAATEVSFEGNLLIQEKWEKYYGQRKVFWSFETEEYEVTFEGFELRGDYQLILHTEAGDKLVLSTYYRSDNGDLCEFSYDYFKNIMGYSGFVFYMERDHIKHGYFYAVEDGEVFCIADTWGIQEREAENFTVDVDGDGVTELICNVTYGDGGWRTFIYHNDGIQILEGNCDEFLDDERYVHEYYMNRIPHYDAEKNVMVIEYYLEDMGEWNRAEYEMDLGKITLRPYQGPVW